MNSPVKQLPLMDVKEKRSLDLGKIEVFHNDSKTVLPLSKVEINASVVNQVSEVTHEQTFQNPFSEHLEATYIFPLPGGAAVSYFEMKTGDKILKGIVKERGEARQEYKKAISEGKKAALLEQERDDIFTVQLGNIPPGQDIQVKITYSEKLPFFENGFTEIRLPLVVAPRYIPGEVLERDAVGKGTESDTDIVPDASRISPPRLAKGFEPKIDLGINVEIFQNENQNISELSCSQHATKTSFGSNRIKIQLANNDVLLDRDFILKWQLTGEELKNDLIFYQDKEGHKYGMLTIIPPKREGFLGFARDIVFIVDRSGSMGGIKMSSATRACSVLLDTLGPNDRFAILAFDDLTEWFKNEDSKLFTYANHSGIEKGNKFLRKVDARGGTEFDIALEEALSAINKREENSDRIPVIVLLTDGEVSDESRILKRVQKSAGDTRIFTVGIDTAVNESFLKRLAILGGGTSAFVVPGEQLETALTMIAREIGTPVLIDINLKDENCGVINDSVSPEKIPDLFAGRSVNVFFKAENAGSVVVTGKFHEGQDFHTVVKGNNVDINAISQLWAKSKVFDLEDQFRICENESNYKKDKNKIKEEIINISVKHSLLTRFTAFIALDESEPVNKDGKLRQIVQPVSEPAKWEMNDQFSGAISPYPLVAPPPSPMPVRSMPSTFPGAPPPIYASAFDAGDFSTGAGLPPSMSMNLSSPNQRGISYKKSLNVKEEHSENEKGFLSNVIGKLTGKKHTAKPSIIENELTKALNNLFTAFENVLTQLQSGNIPTPEDFEKARKEVSKILLNSIIAFELTDLQRFLKKDSLEIIAILKTADLNSDKMYNMLIKYKEIIEKVKISSKNVDSGDSVFWEDSV